MKTVFAFTFLCFATIGWLHAVEYENVKYLPTWRYSGDMSPDRDNQMVMDISVPDDGKRQHPALFVVHGGGWSAGSKDQGVYREIAKYFVERGFVCVRFNYIMRPRGMFPQVFWDYADAARFLRKNAEKYRVDPTKFGAIGLSAGGWLISSAGHASGDLFCLNHQQSIHIGDLWQREWQRDGNNLEETFARPMVDPSPTNADVYSRIQAISYDFSFRTKFGGGNSPACNQWVGAGYELRPEDQAAIETAEFEYSQTVLTHPAYKGRKVHVPPLFASIDKDGKNKAEAISLDGKNRVDAIERIYQFFQYQLIENPRTPMPEIQPTWRVIQGETEVRFIMPMEGAEICFEVVPLVAEKQKSWAELHPPIGDTQKWKTYTKPFHVSADCLVRAVATSEGRRTSTIAQAHFFAGDSGVKVTGPDTIKLPPGETGKPYMVQFESNGKAARWFLAGDLVPHSPRNQSSFEYPNNMVMNYKTGRWSGIPTKPGKYWIQVWVNDRPGGLAQHRNYTWKVTGKDLSDEPSTSTPVEDSNMELVYIPGEKNYPADQLARVLNENGVRVIVQREKQGALFLVQKQERSAARKIIEEYLRSIKFKGEVRWQ